MTIIFCVYCIGAVFKYCKSAYQRRRNGNRAIANYNVQRQWEANFVANGNVLADDVFDDDDNPPIQFEEFIRQEEIRRPLALGYGNRTQSNDLLRFSPDEEELDAVTVV